MKIMQLTVHYAPNVGGVETHLQDLVNGLLELRHSVYVLTYQPLMTKVGWKLFERKSKLRVLRLPWLSGLFYKFVNKPLVEFIYLMPLLFVVSPFVIILFKPQVIHAHGIIAAFIGVFWGKVFRKKVVTSTHSLYEFPKNGMYRRFSKWIFKNSDVVLCLSNQSREEIIGLGLNKNRVKRFTYWIDTKVFKAKSKHITSKKLSVLFVGRLVEAKGVKVLVNAAQKLSKNIDVTFIGDGPLNLYLERKSKTISNIKFIGKVENSKLPNYYNLSDLTIVPSIHEEGFGRVILESLACGVPVVAANRGGIKEALNNDVGTLIDISEDNIVKTLNYLYKNPNIVKSMSLKARKFVVSRYSQKNINKIINSYK